MIPGVDLFYLAQGLAIGAQQAAEFPLFVTAYVVAFGLLLFTAALLFDH